MEQSPWVAIDRPEFRERVKQLSLPESILQPFWTDAGIDYSSRVAALEWGEGVIQLRALDSALGSPVFVEFTRGKSGFRSQRAAHEMIVKAVVGRSKAPLSVVDVTAGLGRDSLILSAAGFQVLAIERHPAVACLLADGLDRAAMHPDYIDILHRVQLKVAQSNQILEQLLQDQRPDVVYMDPMFPERTKQALVKKEMRLFRAVVGDDHDAENLFHQAKSVALKRVVVKRPRKAPCITEQKPGYQLIGKSSRFDVYPV